MGKLVYLDAANPRNGESLVDVAGPILALARQAGRVVDGVELVQLPSPEAGTLLRRHRSGGPRLDGSPADRPALEVLRAEAANCTNESGYAKIPQYHIVCSATLATRDPGLMDEARAAGRLWVIETGHDLMITEPQQVTDALVAVAAG